MKQNKLITLLGSAVLVLASVTLSPAQTPDLVGHNGQKLFLSGGNIAWINFAHDVGPGKTDLSTFDSIFKSVQEHGGNTMRFWVHIDGTNSPAWKGDSVSGPGKETIHDLRAIVDDAWSHHVMLLLSLWSFDMLRKTNSPVVIERNTRLLTDPAMTRKYIDNALIPIVKALKGNPGIIGWEVFNEPEGMSDEFGWKSTYHVPMHDIQRFINLVAGAIHRTDPNAKVTNGSWSLMAQTDVTLGNSSVQNKNYYRDDRLIAAGGDREGTLDFYTDHYYDWQSPGITPILHEASTWKLKKPLVIGEFFLPDSVGGVPYQDVYKTYYKEGYAGALVWQWFDWWRKRPGITDNWPRGLQNMDSMKVNYPEKVTVKATDRESSSDSYREVAMQMQHSLFTDLLNPWYPKSIDTVYGGYYSNFSYDFKPVGTQDKYIVTQARDVWTLSEVAGRYPKYRSTYGPWAKQGVAFLRDKMWDKQYGGFYSLVTRAGKPITGRDPFTGSKTAYGNAFAIYGLAAYYKVFKDTAALDLAIRTFRWLDRHAHDSRYGGYFQNIHRDGTPYRDGFHGQPPKDQNSTIHLLEAFTEFYKVWPDPTLGARLRELLDILRGKIITDRHYMMLFFKADWTPISYRDSLKDGKARYFENDYVSFGHDVETAYLMWEAARALGIDTAPILKLGKAMVDHAINNGWDTRNGGIYDAGYYVKKNGPLTIVRHTKIWWSQAEALNSFLFMASRVSFGTNDPHDYYQHFLKQWQYIQNYLIDHKHGGWYWGGIDEEPEQAKRPKGTIWKATYHDSRALMNCIERLEEMGHSGK